MDYINLLNECPITYVGGSWWVEFDSAAIDSEGMTWEVYLPTGEIQAFSSRKGAEYARTTAITEALA